MEKRKLALIQYIHHITPIEGAGRIECIHVLGWQCVAEKVVDLGCEEDWFGV